MRSSTRYLNTDLDLVSTDDLTPLAEALAGKKWSVLHCGPHPDRLWRAGFEVAGGHREPQKAIAAMLKAIEALPAPLATLWLSCSGRDFNIGFEGGFEPRALEWALPNALLSRLAAAGASVTITIYAVAEEAGGS